MVGFWSLLRDGRRYWVAMLGLAAIGTGSALFHGTLLRFAQAADELPMLGVGLACVWALVRDASPAWVGDRLAHVLGLFGAGFVVAYATVPWAFALFVGVYGVMIAWVALQTARLTWLAPSSPEMKRSALAMLLSFGTAFFVFWLGEHVYLPCDHPLQALQPHSYWHVLGALGTVAWWRWERASRGVRARHVVRG